MALSVTHTFVSAVADDPAAAAAGQVLPQTHWNAVHTVTGDAFTLTTTGSSGASTYSGGTLNIPVYAGGSGGTPGGSNTQVQYNNSGAFGGITGATTNGTTLTLVAPVLGTPASGTLTSCTGLPIATGVSGLGTGVSTALAVNVGTAGSFVVNGGALGTPSSGTLTSCTAFTLTTTGTSGAATYSAGTLNIPQYTGGGGGTPGGSTTQVQYNNAGAFGGISGATTDGTFLTLSNRLTITQASANAGVLTSSGYSVTGSNTTRMLDLSGTVNTSGVIAGVVNIAVTTTALPVGSSLFRIMGGTSATDTAFKITDTGVLVARGVGSASGAGMLLSGDATSAVTVRITDAGNMYLYGDGGSINCKWLGNNTASRFSLDALGSFVWSHTDNDATDSSDIGLSRNGAGIVEVNNATRGTFRDLKLRNLISADANGSYIQTPGMTVANLPASPVRGMRCYVTDSNATSFTLGIGAVAAAGGSTVVPVFYDGTNWRIG